MRDGGRREGGRREDTNFPILCGAAAAAAANTRKYYQHYTGTGRPWLAKTEDNMNINTTTTTTITSITPIQSNISLANLPRNGKIAWQYLRRDSCAKSKILTLLG